MSAKPTGLAAFTKNKGAAELGDVPAKGARKRAEGGIVAMTVRIPRGEWMRLHQLAMAESVSLQTLAVRGFDKVLAEHGLPPIRTDAKAS